VNESTRPAYRLVTRVLTTAVALLALSVAAAFVTGNRGSAFSLAAGSTIGMASFAVLAMVIVRTAAGGRGAVWVAALGLVKILVVGAVLWWLLNARAVEPLAFLGGFSTMVVALLIEGLRVRL